MPISRRADIVAVVLLVTLLVALGDVTGAGGASGHRAPDSQPTITDLERPSDRALRAVTAGSARDDEPVQTFVGIDGREHQVSPRVIAGLDGYYFLGPDFDTACAFGGRIRTSLKRLSKLADILEKSGKQVFFTVSPNKSVVEQGGLPDPLPQGQCGRRGLTVQAKQIDSYRDPRYVPIRQALTQTPHAYWRTDSHWNTVGTAVFAKHLALVLDKELAQHQHFRRTTRTHIGDLAAYVPGLDAETIVARVPDNGVVTAPTRWSEAYDPSLTSVYTDLSWTSRPARKTYPGRTLILGDSFTYVAFESLSNMFRKGRFMWTGYQESMDELIAAINKADTVLLSVVQRNATITPLVDPDFQRQVKAGLRH